MFEEVRALKLPLGRYAITSSGPLGARDIREIGDMDLVVDDNLWDILSQQFGEVEEYGFKKVKIGEHIEVLGVGSNFVSSPGAPTVDDQIRDADIIHDLPFVSLEHVLYFKESMGRAKDAADIVVLKRLLGREAP